ncbi:hypothetical protein FF011L_49170 [Roseimaritima multifibrata]|uniref:Uncharacterized protein n=1 Tax=Roseimaritima multifibrata TaxID=1930274 RepID=A0A517MML9_9BACT|nr:hypothetical protein FF011L_49170 [Roseimaritima multifibrata]
MDVSSEIPAVFTVGIFLRAHPVLQAHLRRPLVIESMKFVGSAPILEFI